MVKKRIAVLFPAFLGGGAEAVCAWILEALKEDFEVTLFTFSDIELEDLDREYGTCLSLSSVKIETIPPPLIGRIWKPFVSSLSAFSARQFALMRIYKQWIRKQHYDLGISAFNEMDLGGRGIQYVHFPMFGANSDLSRSLVGYPTSGWRSAYKRLLRYWAAYSEQRMKQNVTLTNSSWSAQVIYDVYGIKPLVIYPPVRWQTTLLPWADRKDAVAVVARVVPEKNIEVALRALDRVRHRGHQVELYILSGTGDLRYQTELRRLSAGWQWVHWMERLDRQAYERFIGSIKYGFHPRRGEAFGIGVAEMVAAGAIPFVPAEGGQAEIVNHNPHLTWDTEEEAAEKIVQVLENTELQNKLRAGLAELAGRWSAASFTEQIRYAVDKFLAEPA